MENNEPHQTKKSFLTRIKAIDILKGFRITYKVIWNLILIFIIFGVMGVFFVGGAGAGFFASLVQDERIRSYEEMKKDIYNYEEVSEVYFANDDFLGELPSELERREVTLEDISEYLIQAIIATEDEYFFEHDGIVPKALMRATFQELSNSSVQTGGSTLTQQLIKNQILTSEVSFDRKAKEILLAMRLENFFEKEEILEAYLNIVPFGRNANGRSIAGVQAAAQGIFGVDVKDLSLPQAAYIAGLPQSPFGYTPFTNSGEVKQNLDPSLNRMRTVLNRMRDAGYITDKEHQDALTYDIRENLTESTPSTIEQYPFLTYEVERRAIEIIARQMIEADDIDLDELDDEKRLGTLTNYRQQARRDIRRQGYQIHTTVHRDIYDAMQEAVMNDSLFGPDKNGEQEEVGSVLIQNDTGAILGFVGGRDNHSDSWWNFATQELRQNGSTMKPLLAFAPAMEIGKIQPGFIIPDTPMNYQTGGSPSNFDNRYQGIMTAREALQRSRNIPAVKSANHVPYEMRRDVLLKMGITTLEHDEPYESTALGGLKFGVSVEANTAAYATFANQGKFIEPYLIEKIISKDGEVIFQHEVEAVDVFSPQTAYLTIDMLRDVLKPGGGTAASLPGRLKFNADWAGKTGTTNLMGDSWFVGTNPNVTLGVWIGYKSRTNPVSLEVRGMRYGPRTQQIWANLANAAYDLHPELIGPSKRFERPSGIVSLAVCGISGLLPSDLCREAGLVRTDLFNSKFVPTKIDDSLERAHYVTFKDGQKYRALDTTPVEFTSAGIMVKEEFFDMENLQDYIPESWTNIIPDRYPSENNSSPGAVSGVSADGNTITWSPSAENDVVGYRVYKALDGSSDFTKVASIKSSEGLSYTSQSGSFAYYITAVNVSGKESSPSTQVVIGDWRDHIEIEIPEEEKKPEEKPPTEDPEPKPKPEEEKKPEDEEQDGSDNGTNGNGNNGNGNRNGNG